MTAVRSAFDYMFGLGLFGLAYWIYNGIIVEFKGVSSTHEVYDFANYFWWGALIIYLIFGAFWFIRSLKEWDVVR